MVAFDIPPEKISVFSRTYAKKVAGVPKKMVFNSTSSQFELCYEVDASISEPTEIYANFGLHYSNGMNVQVTGKMASLMQTNIDAGNNQVLVTYKNDGTDLNKYANESCCVLITTK